MVDAYGIVKKGDGKDEKAPVEQRLKYLEASAELARIRQNWPDAPMLYAVSDSEPVNARVMVKGDPKMLGPEVPRGFLQILGGQTVPAEYKGSGRDLLADWITDPKNPLTARVMVNRVWLWHFGRGLVNTPNDFGKRGEAPSHPGAARLPDVALPRGRLEPEEAAPRDRADASVRDRRPATTKRTRSRTRRTSSTGGSTGAGFRPKSFATRCSSQRPARSDARRPASVPARGRTCSRSTTRSSAISRIRTPTNAASTCAAALPAESVTWTSSTAPMRTTRRPRRSNNTPLQALFMMNDPFCRNAGRGLAARVSVAEETAAHGCGWRTAAVRPGALTGGKPDGPAVTCRSAKSRGTSDCGREDASAWTGLMRVLLSSNEFFYVD